MVARLKGQEHSEAAPDQYADRPDRRLQLPQPLRHRHPLLELLEPVDDDIDVVRTVVALLLQRLHRDETLSIGSDIVIYEITDR